MGLGPSKNEFLLIRERWAQITNEALYAAGLDLRIDHRSLKARGIDREPALHIPHKIFCIERHTGMPSQVGEAIRASYRERVEAGLKGPDELARVMQRQRESARERAIERARSRSARAKGIRSAFYTAEERLEMGRRLYKPTEALREKRRAYRLKNAELISQKAREARPRASPSPEQRSAQRWLEWKEKHKELTQQKTQALERARERLKQHGSRLTPELTADDSVRKWLAYREREKQAELTQNADRQRARARGLEKSLGKDKEHAIDYDYGL